MASRRLKSITDVAERHLCCGCGACASAQPDAIHMVDDVDAGRRPVVRRVAGRELPTLTALAACPGVELAQPAPKPHEIGELRDRWGPVLEVWEGFATDEEVRYGGSSGGLSTALALHCVREQQMHGVLHIRSRTDKPYLNETVLSTTREELVAATGSRYAPASPADRLDLIAASPSPCVFIGKPCDVAATFKLRRSRPDLDRKLGLTIALFCAGTPSTRGTHEMLAAMGIDDPDRLESLRYRGNGWPGDAVASLRQADGSLVTTRLTYDESWGQILQKHRQWRCYVCADHSGQFADIAVGDPWYRPVGEGDPGRSLILVRTQVGRDILHAAVAAGDIRVESISHELVDASQPGLRDIRGPVGGRIATMRVLGLPAPRFRSMPMLAIWWRDLPFKEKLRSTVGTVRRIWRKRLFRRRPVASLETSDP